MTALDLSFVESARALEVEAVEGGRPLNEFTFDPQTSDDVDEKPVMGRSVDDAEETDERLKLVRQFVPYAQAAYEQRGLVYPFQPTAVGDSLEVVIGQETIAQRSAELSGMIRMGHPISKQFEEAAFRALQRLIGGWGVCVGAPRKSGEGAQKAMVKFRETLWRWEKGDSWPENFARNGDHGADGFLILGRGWGGPIVFFQAKNTNFVFEEHPEEFARIPEVLQDWFGKRWNQYRFIIPVLATNSVLTLEKKDQIFEMRGQAGVQFIDAVDVVCAEYVRGQPGRRRQQCIVY
jgi:hypothetical protein